MKCIYWWGKPLQHTQDSNQGLKWKKLSYFHLPESVCFYSSPACYYATDTRSFIHLTAPLHSAVWVKNSLPHSVPDQNYQTITLIQRRIISLLLHYLTYVKTQHKCHYHKQYKVGLFLCPLSYRKICGSSIAWTSLIAQQWTQNTF